MVAVIIVSQTKVGKWSQIIKKGQNENKFKLDYKDRKARDDKCGHSWCGRQINVCGASVPKRQISKIANSSLSSQQTKHILFLFFGYVNSEERKKERKK